MKKTFPKHQWVRIENIIRSIEKTTEDGDLVYKITYWEDDDES